MERIIIGIPQRGEIAARTVWCLTEALRTLPNYKLLMGAGSPIFQVRQVLAEDAVKTGATHLMFIDSDVIFPKDGIRRLLDHKKPIVGGNYNTKTQGDVQHEPISTVKLLGPDNTIVSGRVPDTLFECFSIATGFMLIDLTILQDIPKPWFDFGQFNGMHMAEDSYFCHKARQYGHKTFCDPTIKMGHIGTTIF